MQGGKFEIRDGIPLESGQNFQVGVTQIPIGWKNKHDQRRHLNIYSVIRDLINILGFYRLFDKELKKYVFFIIIMCIFIRCKYLFEKCAK